jgi:hypothetical protein
VISTLHEEFAKNQEKTANITYMLSVRVNSTSLAVDHLFFEREIIIIAPQNPPEIANNYNVSLIPKSWGLF